MPGRLSNVALTKKVIGLRQPDAKQHQKRKENDGIQAIQMMRQLYLAWLMLSQFSGRCKQMNVKMTYDREEC